MFKKIKEAWKKIMNLANEIKPKETLLSVAFATLINQILFNPLTSVMTEVLKRNGVVFFPIVVQTLYGLFILLGIQALMVAKRKKEKELKKLGINMLSQSFLFALFSNIYVINDHGLSHFNAILSLLLICLEAFVVTKLISIFGFLKKEKQPKTTEVKSVWAELDPKIVKIVTENMQEKNKPSLRRIMAAFKDEEIDNLLNQLDISIKIAEGQKSLNDGHKHEFEQMYNRMEKLRDSYLRLSEKNKNLAKEDILAIIELYKKEVEAINEESEQFHLREIKKMRRVVLDE